MHPARTSIGIPLLLALACSTPKVTEPPVPLESGVSTGGALAVPMVAAPESEDLRVTYLAPRGTLSESPTQIVAMFSQPMIALGGNRPVPIEMAPPIETRARWIGTTVAVLVPVRPLAPATRFTVRVPAGTKSLSGKTLASPVEATFETPRPEVSIEWPGRGGDGCSPRQPFVVRANQTLKPESLTAVSRIEYGQGGKTRIAKVTVTRATKTQLQRTLGVWRADRIFAEDETDMDVKPGEEGRWFLLEPVQPLPTATKFRIKIGPALVSEEGPLPSVKVQSFDFKTVEPLKVVRVGCGDRALCSPDLGYDAVVVFNNQVSTREMAAKIRVAGRRARETENLYDYPSREFQPVEEPQPETEYVVEIPANLTDVHGQTLGKPFTAKLRFGRRDPLFSDPNGGGVLEAAGPRRYPFVVRNLLSARAELAAVPATSLIAVTRAAEEPKFDLRRLGMDPKQAVLGVSRDPDTNLVSGLDLSPVVPAGSLGAVAYRAWAEAPSETPKAVAEGIREHQGVILVTDIGITTKLGRGSTLIWTTALSTGVPLPDVAVEIRDSSDRVLWSGKTGKTGLAVGPGRDAFPPPPKPRKTEEEGWEPEDLGVYVVARSGADISVVKLGTGESVWARIGDDDWESGIEESTDEEDPGSALDDTWRVSFALDRDVYKENDTVQIKGWVRKMTDSGPVRAPGGKATLRIRRPGQDEGPPLKEIAVVFDDFGAFATTWKVPGGAAHGEYRIDFVMPGEEEKNSDMLPGTTFRVAFYEAPEFVVSVRTDRKEYIRGDKVALAVDGHYYFGGPMAGARGMWSTSSTIAGFRPLNGKGYVFDDFVASAFPDTGAPPAKQTRLANQGSLTLDDSGRATATVDVVPMYRHPCRVTFETELMDTSGRAVSARTSAFVHPAEFYLGLKTAGSLVDVGKLVTVQVIALDPAGAPAPVDNVAVTLVRREWHTVRRKGIGDSYTVVSEPVNIPIRSENLPLTGGKGAVSFTPDAVGYYLMAVAATDPRGNRVRASTSINVVGDGLGAWERFNDSSIEVTADRADYRPGDKAKLLIRSPFAKAWALVTVERRSVLHQEVVELTGDSTAISLPILAAFAPNVNVTVAVVRGRIGNTGGTDDDPDDESAPTIRLGAVALRVSPDDRHLAVEVKPAATEYRPGQDVIVDLAVRDAAGRPAKSQVLVMAVDAAVLDLTGYRLKDPFKTFFAAVDPSVLTSDSRDFLIKRRTYGEKSESPGGDGGGEDLRGDFVAVAFYDPAVATGEDGTARVTFKAPDNLTRFRVMAVAVSGDSLFGTGRSEFTVNRPFLVRPALPPFAEVGDTFRMAVAVHGSRGLKGEAKISVSASGGLALVGPAMQDATVDGEKPVEVFFDLKAVAKDTGEVKVRGVLGKKDDGVVLKVPVRRRVTPETVAVAGQARTQVSEALTLPTGVAPDVGGLRVSAASTALVGLDQASRYLVEYPHGCLEQRASAMLPALLLEELSETFGFPVAERQALRDSVQDSLNRYSQFQRADGGFGFWPSRRDESVSDPYLTAYAVRVASIARDRGYTVDSRVLTDAVVYLGKALRATGTPDKPGSRMAPDEAAFVAWVLMQEKARIADVIKLLVANRDGLSLAGLAWLVAAASGTDFPKETLDGLVKDLTRAAVVKGNEAILSASGESADRLGFGSRDVLTTSAAIIALNRAAGDHALLPLLVNHLMNQRRQGRWDTTHENGMALLALTAWYRDRESGQPNLKTTAYLGPSPLATWTFAGRETVSRSLYVPIERLLREANVPLTLARSGEGPLYYSLSLTFTRPSATEAVDRGVFVTRSVRSLASPEAVTTLPRGRLGAVIVTLASPTPLDRVAISVPVPAGFVPVNFDFETSSRRTAEDLASLAFQGALLHCDHKEVRDDRVTCFADRVPAGLSTFRFAGRAVIPGTFVFPAATVEEMYHSETGGRSEAGTFRVE